MSNEVIRPARIRFLTTVEGGRRTDAISGIRPQLQLDGASTSCIVVRRDGGSLMPLGEEVEVILRPMFAEYAARFLALRSVRLLEGSHLIAIGEFLD